MIQNWASLVEGVAVRERRAFALKTPELEKNTLCLLCQNERWWHNCEECGVCV